MSTDELLTNLRLDVARLEGKVDAYGKMQGIDRGEIKKLEGRLWALLVGVGGAFGTALLSLFMARSAVAHQVAMAANEFLAALTQ